MGASIASGFPSQHMSASFYGNGDHPKLLVRPAGRRRVPGGPILPTLPRNP